MPQREAQVRNYLDEAFSATTSPGSTAISTPI